MSHSTESTGTESTGTESTGTESTGTESTGTAGPAPVPEETPPGQLEQILAETETAATAWAQRSLLERARALRAMADALDAASDQLLPAAEAETHLLPGRLAGELKRTTFQLRLFAELLEDGGYLDVRIDHADDQWPMGARPDLRRMLEPLGPVLVFAASNFPFAFSVAGGDTCAALAAGCPVVLKVHPGHPRLSALVGEVVSGALEAAGAPANLLQLVYGTEAGRTALLDPRIKAASFTGSIAGGRALFDLAVSRPEPIPFYGELGSVNPTFVTRSAAAERGSDIADAFVGSYTLGAGQFCTKPGILLIPEDSDMLGRLASGPRPDAAPLLNDRIQSGYVSVLKDLLEHDAVDVLGSIEAGFDTPPAPILIATTAAAVVADPAGLVTECFGPTALVVTYRDEDELLDVADVLDGQLTATIHGEESDVVVPELLRRLATKAGRVLWNDWPTGVSVTHAQHHGGPYPATTSPGTTSVGTAGIVRFLRPVAYQGVPAALLPPALRDDNPLGIPQRVDGTLRP